MAPHRCTFVNRKKKREYNNNFFDFHSRTANPTVPAAGRGRSAGGPKTGAGEALAGGGGGRVK